MIKATDIHKSYGALEVLRGVSLEAVSYTHLTLPTICSV